MRPVFTNNNIVVVGVFKEWVFDKYFFIKSNLFKEEEITNKSVFVQDYTELITSTIRLTIQPGKIQIGDITIGGTSGAEMLGIISAILKLVDSNISIKGVGINFNCFTEDESKSIEQLSKEWFYSDNVSLFSKYFNSEDVAYGTYVSKKIKDARLRLEIKPVTGRTSGNGTEVEKHWMAWDFNFHLDVKDSNNTSEAFHFLNDYVFYKEESNKIMSLF